MTEHKIITRVEAKARGLKRYFTGKPCKHGHVAERLVSDRTCAKCHNKQRRKKYATDPEWAARERERWREYVRDKMAAGLCVQCGKEPAVTKRYCWTCADKDNARRYML